MYSYWKNNQLKLSPWLFLAPGIFIFLLYVIVPIFQSVALSFYEWDGLGLKTYIGLSNYVELLDDYAFHTSLKNNVIWLLLCLLAIPAGLFTALFLNQTVHDLVLVHVNTFSKKKICYGFCQGKTNASARFSLVIYNCSSFRRSTFWRNNSSLIIIDTFFGSYLWHDGQF